MPLLEDCGGEDPRRFSTGRLAPRCEIKLSLQDPIWVGIRARKKKNRRSRWATRIGSRNSLWLGRLHLLPFPKVEPFPPGEHPGLSLRALCGQGKRGRGAARGQRGKLEAKDTEVLRGTQLGGDS